MTKSAKRGMAVCWVAASVVGWLRYAQGPPISVFIWRQYPAGRSHSFEIVVPREAQGRIASQGWVDDATYTAAFHRIVNWDGRPLTLEEVTVIEKEELGIWGAFSDQRLPWPQKVSPQVQAFLVKNRVEPYPNGLMRTAVDWESPQAGIVWRQFGQRNENPSLTLDILALTILYGWWIVTVFVSVGLAAPWWSRAFVRRSKSLHQPKRRAPIPEPCRRTGRFYAGAALSALGLLIIVFSYGHQVQNLIEEVGLEKAAEQLGWTPRGLEALRDALGALVVSGIVLVSGLGGVAFYAVENDEAVWPIKVSAKVERKDGG
jgi:hypothetical protein